MSSLRKKLKQLAEVGLVGATLMGGAKVLTTAADDRDDVVHSKQGVSRTINDARSLVDENLSFQDQEALFQLVSWAEEIPSGRQILKAMCENGTKLTVSDLPDEVTGNTKADLSSITFSKALLSNEDLKYIALWTFAHEGEHVRTIALDHANGITIHSFESADDKYVYETLREALAERKAAMVVAEFMQKNPDWQYTDQYKELLKTKYGEHGELSKLAEAVFDHRMHNRDMLIAYDGTPFLLDEKEIKNGKHFDQNPDWNQIVAMTSGGEVKQINSLPIPSFVLLDTILLVHAYDQEKNSMPVSFKDLDLSCFNTNKTEMLENGKFCEHVWDKMYSLGMTILHDYDVPDDKGPWLDEFKELMPVGMWAEMQKDKNLTDEEWDHIWQQNDMDSFLEKQDKKTYLQKALNILSSPNLPGHKQFYAYRNTEHCLSFYKTYFFSNNNQQTLKRDVATR